ncbi:hypothetical protein C8Q76DRAFT_754763 [Earliella scabrosa]|nr:hypothetical protein C8Q76DRAFT_754763 [Earliella scabrosa]
MAGRSAHVRRVSVEPPRGPDRPRSSSHGDAGSRRPYPAQLSPHHLPPVHSRSPSPGPPPPPALSTSASAAPGEPSTEHVHRRLAFFGDMLQLSSAGLLAAAASSPASVASSAQRSATTPIPSSLLPARSHSRADSALPRDSRDGAHSPVPSGPMAAPPAQNKGHTSPSKVSLFVIRLWMGIFGMEDLSVRLSFPLLYSGGCDLPTVSNLALSDRARDTG